MCIQGGSEANSVCTGCFMTCQCVYRVVQKLAMCIQGGSGVSQSVYRVVSQVWNIDKGPGKFSDKKELMFTAKYETVSE